MTISRWRAPREDGATLVAPDWAKLPELVSANQQYLKGLDFSLGHLSFREARQMAQENLQQVTSTWAIQAGLPATSLKRPLLMTGHQPELYHPGVWAKNVAIHQLAKHLGGSGINLNVDADVAKTTALKLPVCHGERPDSSLDFGPAQPAVPYEEWICQDEAAFAQVGLEILSRSRDWPWQPIFPAFWDRVLEQRERTNIIPYRWLLARHYWEREHSIANHEFLMSQWCNLPFFRWLMQLFITDAAWFARVYNEELLKYRKEHRIRSAHHPVADLRVTSDLVELPFWAWPVGSSQRGRLCVRNRYGSLDLLSLSGDKETLIATQGAGQDAEHLSNWKFRPKALITSMMFRLFVADLFVHGIGGAVYDELTDRIFQRYWKVKLPAFAVITATLRLPWHRQPVDSQQPHTLRQTLRAMHWNPDRFLREDDAAVAFLKEEKAQWTRLPIPVTKLLERHEQLEAIREQLQPLVAPQVQALELQLQQSLHDLKRDEHHFSREYSWLLYPQEQLLSLRDQFSTI